MQKSSHNNSRPVALKTVDAVLKTKGLYWVGGAGAGFKFRGALRMPRVLGRREVVATEPAPASGQEKRVYEQVQHVNP